MSDSLPQKLSDLDTIRQLKDRLAAESAKTLDAQRQITHLTQELKDAEKRGEVILALRQNTSHTSIPIKATSKTSESVACAMLGDWHAEEEVLPEKISGMNEYNLAIADKRINNVANNVPTLLNQFRHGTKINHLVVHLLGDFMTGVIHEELQETNSLSPIRTVLWLQDKLEGMLRYWLKSSSCRITCVCNVGNHGRTTDKTRIKTRVDNSFEYLMYRWLAKALPEIDWQIAEGYHLYLPVYDATWRHHHGDSINYNGGVGGITIPVNKAIAQWDKARRADIDLFGHYHQYKQDTKWLCNGSLIGYSDYSLEIKADFEPPQQTLFLWEKDHGRTITTPIHV